MDKVASKPNLQKKNSEEPIKNVVSHRSKSVLTDENFKRTKPKVKQFLFYFVNKKYVIHLKISFLILKFRRNKSKHPWRLPSNFKITLSKKEKKELNDDFHKGNDLKFSKPHLLDFNLKAAKPNNDEYYTSK